MFCFTNASAPHVGRILYATKILRWGTTKLFPLNRCLDKEQEEIEATTFLFHPCLWLTVQHLDHQSYFLCQFTKQALFFSLFNYLEKRLFHESTRFHLRRVLGIFVFVTFSFFYFSGRREDESATEFTPRRPHLYRSCDLLCHYTA